MNEPVYVQASEFYLREKVQDRKHLDETKHWMVLLFILSLILWCVVILAISFTLKPTTGLSVAVCGIVGAIIGLIAAMTYSKIAKLINRLDRSARNLDLQIDRAKTLNKYHAFFDDTQSQWGKLSDPAAEIERWCRTGGIPATIARYDDYMMGQFGVFVSFSRSDDETAQENLLLFKMRFMDSM